MGGVINQGDDIYFKRGDAWNEDLGSGQDSGLDLKLGGTESNYMVIGAYGTGSKPVIKNINSGDSRCLNCDDSLGYVTIENLNFTGGNTSEYDLIHFENNADYENIHFDDIEVYNSGGHGLFLYRTNGYRIENSVISPNNANGSAIVIYGYHLGNRISNGKIRNCTLSNCKDGISLHFGDSGEVSGRLGNNHWIDNVTIYNSSTSEEAIDIVGGIGCENVLVENCNIYNSGSVVIGHGISNVLFRNNHIHDMPDNCLVVTKTNNTIVRNTILQNWSSIKRAFLKSGATESKNIILYNCDIISNGTGDLFKLSNDI